MRVRVGVRRGLRWGKSEGRGCGKVRQGGFKLD